MLVLLASLLLIASSSSLSPNASIELIDRIFNGYNAQASPYVARHHAVADNSTALSVAFRLSRAVIASVNERDWTISVLVSANYKWRDPRFIWNPAEHDDISVISMKADAVWQPDVYPCESSKVGNVLKEASPSVLIRHDGSVHLDAYQMVQYICRMKFDAFPFDQQHCSLCFALDGIAGTSITLDDVTEHPFDLRLSSISEWKAVGNLTRDYSREVQGAKQTHRVRFHISLARYDFFWVCLIIIPTCLFCLTTLVGAFFYTGDDAIQNAATIGLTTMTSLMLVVTILSDALDKADTLPGLGWFVFVEIVVVCVSVILLLLLDGARAVARGYEKRQQEHWCILLSSKRAFRATRSMLFLLSITALGMNAALCWT